MNPMNKLTTIGLLLMLLTVAEVFSQVIPGPSNSSWEAFDMTTGGATPQAWSNTGVPFSSQPSGDSLAQPGYELYPNGQGNFNTYNAYDPYHSNSPVEQSGFSPGDFSAYDVSGQNGSSMDGAGEQNDGAPWQAQVLPAGLIYPSYLAGRKEPRLASEMTNERKYGWLWDITLGGRMPLFRYGTVDPIQPEGFQIDLEGATLLRLDFERDRELAGTDYRAGLPLSYGTRHWQYKLAYYHVSSHLGDHYMQANFRTPRVQYVRDSIVGGVAWRPWRPFRVYGEVGWAFNTGETTEPFEIQFGLEYTQPYQPAKNWTSSPFAAVDVHLFQELDFSGYINFQAGWQWRGPINNLFRLGVEVYSGCDDQFQFHTSYQRKIGFGIWYDF